MTRETIFTETLCRATADLEHIDRSKVSLPLLLAARGSEVLRENGYEARPAAGTMIWKVGPADHQVYAVPNYQGMSLRHVPQMHCFIYEKSEDQIIDFSVEWSRYQCDLLFGRGRWTCPVLGSRFLWCRAPAATIGGAIVYTEYFAATLIMQKHWESLAAGPLRLQRFCDCGLIWRQGQWFRPSAPGKVWANELAWTGRVDRAVCPGCRELGSLRGLEELK